MSEISYHFNRNTHSLAGARHALAYLLSGTPCASLLDVGAGLGNWLRAAREMGIDDIFGFDGVAADPAELHVEANRIATFDLRRPVSLGRRFDVVLCLEVAEHLHAEFAGTIVETLCRHGDLIFFSAAAPGQHGEHHVNCQWPTYWQALFNAQGYVCRDDMRSEIWNDGMIEPWYRQNLFSARRDPEGAGKEPRIQHLIHPEMTRHMDFPDSPLARRLSDLSQGKYHPTHYLRLLNRSVGERYGVRLPVR
ncbi:class I SAM-dependent methyltransferase [Hyphomicrobium sp.]|uniref:class I SAM-dependent methyltransferase n=1 Tax=Hyphomicrobium sp. TaxID=82 RepID=UPI002D76A5E7|nr:methyltransferase domain-containing protein [Hyphomicrobium sp.]HET6390422.1 methyltransferase domain-containing protein [Hyphomicrobium sp.]